MKPNARIASADLPCFIHFNGETCGNLEQAERREWWLADGFGGYAAGTVAQSATRRYHGLLFAADPATLARRLLFARAEAVLIDGAQRHALSVNHWASGAVDPAGHRLIAAFWLEGSTPVWRFEIDDIVVEQRIGFVLGETTLCLAWKLVRPIERPLALEIALLCDDRDHHGETRADARGDLSADLCDGRLRLLAGSEAKLHFASAHGEFRVDPAWYRDFQMPAEHARGLPDVEDHFRVGHLRLALVPGRQTGFCASPQARAAVPDIETALTHRRHYDGNRIQHATLCAHGYDDAPDWIRQLLIDSDRYLIRRARPQNPPPPTDLPYWNDRCELADGAAVIAGYPWFADWGRDTFIALPGLALATGRFVVARRILESWAGFIDAGMLPNLLPEHGGGAEYNSADAALWYIEAWRAYHAHTRDQAALRHIMPALEGIVEAYARGTRYGIGADPDDALLRAGEPGSQITWMDARVRGEPVTPRIGKPVELNALWYNALRSLECFATQLGREAAPYAARAARVRASFARFILPHGGLADVLDGPDGNDDRLRPNQIFAVSLAHSPLGQAAQQRVVAAVAGQLLTPFGLRTLAPGAPGYRAYYQGGVDERDGSYHQGPAWGWLLGHYALAEYRACGDAEQALARLEPLRAHLLDVGLGSISELFDGDAPHAPGGAPCQAWSVACTLQAWQHLARAAGKARERQVFAPVAFP